MTEGPALHWRLIKPRYNLEGTECETCGGRYFPPRNICPECRRKGEIKQYKFNGEGEIYSYTIIRATPVGHEYQKPYVVAIVKLEEGPHVTAQIVDCDIDNLEIGTQVKQVFRKVMAQSEEGVIQYAYKFKPVD